EDEDEQPKPKHKKKGSDDEPVDEPKKVKHKTGGGGGGDDEADEPKRKKKLAEGDEDDSPLPKSKAKKKRTARDEDDEVEESSEEEPGSELAPSPHAASRAAVRVDAGISAASRVLDFNARQYDQAPKDVPNSLVPGARVAVELYPFAFSNPRSPAAGLGLWGDFDKTISLTLQTRDPLDPNHIVAAKANQQRWAIGVGYRFAFTRSDLSPTVSVGINYAKQQFKADTSTLMGVVLDMPDTEYSMVQPVVNVRIPFAKPVALVAGGRGMLISDAGAITKGDQYGQAKVFGVSAMGGLDFIISNRFAVRVTGEFSQIGFTFTKGAGAKANNRDGDPNTKDVFGAADRSMGGSVTLGVLY
ncbi:MAG: hypothetical protein NT062_14520, partial [Proteobacteria bacterium]|nr:hypothetical protein [Pseudomonadota bacterium]